MFSKIHDLIAVRQYRSENPVMRMLAIERALAHSKNKRLIRYLLTRAVRDSDPRVREKASWVLQDYVSPSQLLLLGLRILEDEAAEESLLVNAKKYLRHSDRDSVSSTEKLLRSLERIRNDKVVHVISRLEHMNCFPEGTAERILKAVSARSLSEQLYAVRVFQKLGPKAACAMPFLIDCLALHAESLKRGINVISSELMISVTQAREIVPAIEAISPGISEEERATLKKRLMVLVLQSRSGLLGSAYDALGFAVISNYFRRSA